MSPKHTHTHTGVLHTGAQHAHMHTILMRWCDLDVFNFGNLEGLVPSSLVWHTLIWTKTHWSGRTHTDVVWCAPVWSDTRWCALTRDKTFQLPFLPSQNKQISVIVQHLIFHHLTVLLWLERGDYSQKFACFVAWKGGLLPKICMFCGLKGGITLKNLHVVFCPNE